MTQSNRSRLPGRLVVVQGPKDVDSVAALFSYGVDVGENDRIVTISRPGNIEVEVFESSELYIER